MPSIAATKSAAGQRARQAPKNERAQEVFDLRRPPRSRRLPHIPARGGPEAILRDDPSLFGACKHLIECVDLDGCKIFIELGKGDKDRYILFPESFWSSRRTWERWRNDPGRRLIRHARACLGGNGYVDDCMMPRLYREAPVNSIWEGCGNVICLDILRAMKKDPEIARAVLDEARLSRSGESPLRCILETARSGPP